MKFAKGNAIAGIIVRAGPTYVRGKDLDLEMVSTLESGRVTSRPGVLLAKRRHIVARLPRTKCITTLTTAKTNRIWIAAEVT